jgi:hypothetical protein
MEGKLVKAAPLLSITARIEEFRAWIAKEYLSALIQCIAHFPNTPFSLSTDRDQDGLAIKRPLFR